MIRTVAILEMSLSITKRIRTVWCWKQKSITISSLEYIIAIDSNAGISTGKEYSNKIDQSIKAQLGVPF